MEFESGLSKSKLIKCTEGALLAKKALHLVTTSSAISQKWANMIRQKSSISPDKVKIDQKTLKSEDRYKNVTMILLKRTDYLVIFNEA